VESTDCDIIDRQQDMTLCVEQDDEIIINPDTNHNHQPLLSAETNTKQFVDSRLMTDDTKDSSTVKFKNFFLFSKIVDNQLILEI